MWTDLQDAFFIVLGPFLADIVLPLFVVGGILAAIFLGITQFWKPGGQR